MSANDYIGEIRDELKAYKEQLDLLKEDLEIILRFGSFQLANQYATGVPSADPVLKAKCLKFVERYRHLVQ